MNYFEETKRVLDNSNFFFIITTAMDGTYSYVNAHYSNEFSYISDRFVGQPYHITMHPDDQNTCAIVAAQCFEHPDQLFPATIRKHDGKGGYVITQWEYKAMLDEDKNPMGVFCLGYNITKFVEDAKKLVKAQEEIQKKEHTLEKIAFQQSHLIRAPLSNIIGLAQMLDPAPVDPDTRHIYKMILDSSKQLDVLIKEIVKSTE